MIVAVQKPLEEVFEFTRPFRKVLLLGCGTCVTVCSAGGEKEVATLASALALKSRSEGLGQEFLQNTIERQCDREFIEQVIGQVNSCDAVVSLACGAGVQLLAQAADKAVKILPGLNTKFIAVTAEQGVWKEYCRGCGDCILHITEGICPVTRCSKGLMNGPCGGYSKEGKCEADPQVECAWLLIFERARERGRLSELRKLVQPRNWSQAAAGVPKAVVREDLRLVQDAQA